jgi:hypothetical protein
MSTIALEIHDAGILAVVDREPDEICSPPSPGYALLDGTRLLAGEEAARHARIKPRLVHHRFWHELDTTPLKPPFPRNLSEADLAHTHLSGVWNTVKSGATRAILVVPGGSSETRLGLILGIARACEIPVSGMVDAAVAAASGDIPEGQLLHVDVQLHRAVVTELVRAEEVVRRRVDIDEHTGLIALHDAWVKRIAAVFIHNTRFDPLHSAATEQELYDQLPHWLARLNHEDTTLLAMRAGDKEHSVTLVREQLLATAEAYYERIVQLVSLLKRGGARTVLLLTHRIAALPGLEERLGGISRTEVVTLGQTAALAGALAERERICADAEELPFVVHLPVQAVGESQPRRTPTAQPDTETRGAARPPTHLLHDDVAREISDDALLLGVAIPDRARGVNLTGRTAGISRSHCSVYRRDHRVWVEDHSTHGSFVNDERVEGKTVLAVGDRLRLGSPGIELRLIFVAQGPDDEATQD